MQCLIQKRPELLCCILYMQYKKLCDNCSSKQNYLQVQSQIPVQYNSVQHFPALYSKGVLYRLNIVRALRIAHKFGK